MIRRRLARASRREMGGDSMGDGPYGIALIYCAYCNYIRPMARSSPARLAAANWRPWLALAAEALAMGGGLRYARSVGYPGLTAADARRFPAGVDTIVVGAGTAGAVVAGRLAAGSFGRPLLREAG